MRESEITVQVFDCFEKIDNILKSQGFAMIENYQLNDWYFTRLEDISNLKYDELINNSFLVREIKTEETKIQLCYKQKEFDENNNVISEEKITSNIEDLNNTLNIFKKAKLNNYCIVKNNSFVYKKEDICFALQIIENLGIFIEYEEDETMKDLTTEQKIVHMFNLVKNLGLNIGNDYSCKKAYMLLQKQNI